MTGNMEPCFTTVEVEASSDESAGIRARRYTSKASPAAYTITSTRQ